MEDMVRLNKTHLQEEQINKLFFQLATMLTSKQAGHVNAVLFEILGREEQIMIAKRLAVILLISEGLSSYKIGNTLKLSESTIASIRNKLANDEYDTIMQNLGKSKKKYFDLLTTLDSILHLGGILPHYNGLDRYKGL